MMIEIERLSKRYGNVRAVDRLTFSVERGEVVGLLGPNGAGKTTTMRMLTTYLAPTSGRARLAGHDVLDEPVAVRRKVGYLPESVPLYTEMRVREYLDFRARLRDVPRRGRRASVDAAIARCGLADVGRRILGQLSRGYRQRVGLADAMVHDPDILILDEPTSGLDPIQIREVRALIRELADRRTILLSTHILPEVEAVCGRALIIARGQVAADERLGRARAEGAIVVEARGPSEPIRNLLGAIPGVARVAPAGHAADHSSFEVTPAPGQDPREAIARALVQGGWPPRRLDLKPSTLEERFVRAVARAGGDAPETEAA